ncbi:ATP-binding protein [Fundidesulfovibrio butyratiphilus]
MSHPEAPSRAAAPFASVGEQALAERVRALEEENAALREAKDFFSHILDGISDPIFVKDPEHRFLYVNRALCDLLGAGREDVIGRRDTDFFPPEQTRMFQANDDEVLRTGRGNTVEETVTPAEGGTRFILTQKNLYLDTRGHPCVVGVTRDVSVLKKAQENLRASQRLVNRLLENIPAAVHVAGVDGRLRLVNRAWEEITGLRAEEAVGRSVEEVFPAESAKFPHFVGKAGQGAPIAMEQYGDFQGERRHFHTVKFPLYDEDGNLEAVGSISMEVTRLTRAKEALRESARASEAANRAKTELLANMSHELRTPISAILGLAELSHHIAEPEKTAGHLNLIAQSARALLNIVDDVLDLSAMESGALVLDSEPFVLASALDHALTPFLAACKEKGLALTLDIPPDLPAKLVGDAGRLRQVLSHLLGNAVKFTAKGQVSFAVTTAQVAPDKVRLHFTVRDTGIGVARKDAARIFESFHQGDASLSKAFQGAGLGLALCRDLAVLMGGEVWVDSTPGQGSAFHFTAVFGLAVKKTPIAKPRLPRPGPPPQGARVLVAEDNPINSHVFQEFLESQGHTVRVASGGLQALEMLKNEPFDLVFMDVQMPGMDGLEAVGRIRRGECGPGCARLPVIALTGYAMPGDRERFLRAGMTGYLAKPVHLSSLIETLCLYVPGAARDQGAPAPEIQEAYRPLIKDFIRFVRERMGQLRQALGRGELDEAARAAHDIKGTSMAFGAKAVNSLGAQLERALGAGGETAPPAPREAYRLLDSLSRELVALGELEAGQ